ncbi:MAG: hypothetical protein U0176_01365 [Bacteroidia bacterium]
MGKVLIFKCIDIDERMQDFVQKFFKIIEISPKIAQNQSPRTFSPCKNFLKDIRLCPFGMGMEKLPAAIGSSANQFLESLR